MTREEALDELKLLATKKRFKLTPGEAPALDMAIKALEQEPCEDVISRKSITEHLNNAKMFFDYDGVDTFDKGRKNGLIDAMDIVTDEPSVYPKPKTGHWILEDDKEHGRCSECGCKEDLVDGHSNYKWCSNCGVKMIDPQESER